MFSRHNLIGASNAQPLQQKPRLLNPAYQRHHNHHKQPPPQQPNHNHEEPRFHPDNHDRHRRGSTHPGHQAEQARRQARPLGQRKARCSPLPAGDAVVGSRDAWQAGEARHEAPPALLLAGGLVVEVDNGSI